jgi:hypothetical protein
VTSVCTTTMGSMHPVETTGTAHQVRLPPVPPCPPRLTRVRREDTDAIRELVVGDEARAAGIIYLQEMHTLKTHDGGRPWTVWGSPVCATSACETRTTLTLCTVDTRVLRLGVQLDARLTA